MHTQPSAMLQDALYVFTPLSFPVCRKGSRDGELSCFWPAEQQSSSIMMIFIKIIKIY